MAQAEGNVVYRCRLYQDKEETFPGEHFVTEVWDHPEKLRNEAELPQPSDWEPVGDFSGGSFDDVRKQVDERIKELGDPGTGDWDSKGMI